MQTYFVLHLHSDFVLKFFDDCSVALLTLNVIFLDSFQRDDDSHVSMFLFE